MITISDYISHLLNELSQARRMCDAESLRVAKAYADDDLLRHFPVPRFKLSEVELSIPIAVSDMTMEDNLSFALSEQNFLYAVKKELDQQTSRVYGDVRAESAGNTNIYPLIEQWYSDLNSCKSWGEFDKCFDRYFLMITEGIKDTFVPAGQSEVATSNTGTISPVNLYENLKRRFEVSKSLKNVLIEPQSAAVNKFGTDTSLLIVKAKISEEGIAISSVTDEKGEKKYSINFD